MTDLNPPKVNLDDIVFNKMIPVKHMEPMGGLLPTTDEAAALWYFIGCASQAYQRVESQTTLEGDEDQAVDVMQIAHSVRNIYGLKDLDGMFNYELIATAKQEAKRSKLPWDSQLDTFFSSGGSVKRYLDRDANKL